MRIALARKLACARCKTIDILIARSSGAWQEHATRLTLRQHVINFYLVTCIAMFGVYFYSGETAKPHDFLLIGIGIMNLVSALLICAHNRVIADLEAFMCYCEMTTSKALSGTIKDIDEDESYYFVQSSRSTKPDKARQHAYNRRAQKIVYAVIFSLFAGLALIYAYSGACLASLFLGVLCWPLSVMFVVAGPTGWQLWRSENWEF